MYDELIKQARELDAIATRGPWEAIRDKSVEGERHVCHAASDEDAAFIAASRTLVPQLCDALEAAQKENERLKAEKQTEFDIATGYHKKWQKAEERAEKADAERMMNDGQA